MRPVLLVLAPLATSLCGQAPELRPRFEVVSIKIKAPSETGPADLAPHRSGDRVTMHNTQLELVVPYAYRVQPGYPVEGNLHTPEGWRWFDIDAIVSGSPTDDEIRQMFQSLLEERFKLKVHYETRPLDVYRLVLGKKKQRLHAWHASAKPPSVRGKVVAEGTVGNYSSRDDPYHIVGRKVPMTKLALHLSLMVRTPVADRTGLSGYFDFDLSWGLPEDSQPGVRPDPSVVAAALREQIGLRLIRAKEPIEVLVVDRFEKPSPN